MKEGNITKDFKKVSVAVITYNQEKTIAQTLDSILAQKGDFELELVIGEDCSKDRTLVICESYAQKYPASVKLLSGPENLGIMGNYARTISACTGDFIAIIAGDDYYCNELALHKQLDFFMANPDYGVISSNGYRHFVKRKKFVEGIAPLNPIQDGNIKEFYFSKNYRGGVYATPVGMIMRKEMLQHIDFAEILKRRLPVEDYPIQAILSQYTRFAKLAEPFVVYRVYSESATFLSIDNPKYLEYHKGLANTRRYLNELFPQDACISEEWLQDYVFYKEFLLYLHKLQYKKAIKLINDTCASCQSVPKAKKRTKAYIHFLLFHIYKEYCYLKDRKKRT